MNQPTGTTLRRIDVYQYAATALGITTEKVTPTAAIAATKEMLENGWTFVGYDREGYEIYQEKDALSELQRQRMHLLQRKRMAVNEDTSPWDFPWIWKEERCDDVTEEIEEEENPEQDTTETKEKDK